MPLEAGLLAILACPACHAPLREESGGASTGPSGETSGETSGGEVGTTELVCTGCGLAYPVRDGIPVLLVDEARRPA
ncbi:MULTISPECIES: Trm112 family protein [Streptomyces]|uniref:Trm112 family protein n=1 Tax=Streptomyces TaxID=1883 RepID=UPI001D146BD9|nr:MULTISPECIES: Trm112 family protein [Streptomyces]MCC3653587.1 Trm112 family protein [Streptomyces sp. S07_1.15]WSQ71880.1 Trm112 family protein [Streptomyces xinghaiensis]